MTFKRNKRRPVFKIRARLFFKKSAKYFELKAKRLYNFKE